MNIIFKLIKKICIFIKNFLKIKIHYKNIKSFILTLFSLVYINYYKYIDNIQL